MMNDFEPTEQTQGEKIQISLVLYQQSPTPLTATTPSLEVPPQPIAIPANTRRRGLSAIVNHLLNRRVLPTHGNTISDSDSEDEDKLPSLPFDFLLADRLLRTSVESAARRDGLSLEQAVTIHYFPARNEPEGDGTSETLPDWVTALTAVDGDGGIISAGGSDGVLRLYNGVDMTPYATVKAHSSGIQALDSVANGAGGMMVASGSMDQTLVTHCCGRGGKGLSLHAIYGGGHGASVTSVAMGGEWMASGDWSGGLCVWKVPDVAMEEKDAAVQPEKKKTKKGSDGTAVVESVIASSIEEVAPTISLKAHSNDVSGIAWGYDGTSSSTGNKTIFTSSWDHSIKSWDVETQNVVLTLNGSKVATCLTRCQNSNVVASGHPDCTVRLWDMRVSTKGSDGEGGFFDGTLRPSHNAWISAVKWSQDPYVLTSASHDGSVKVWDIRSSLPLHTVRAHPKGQKALCIAVTEEAVYSGGSDCVVKRFKF